MSARPVKIRNKAHEASSGSGQASSGPGPTASAPRIRNAIGLLELTSIAKGIEATDLMLKASDVELLASRSICSGKYMVLVRGDVAACAASVAAGEAVARETTADSIVIPNLHDEVFPAIAQAAVIDEVAALGVLEAFNVATLIEGADAAVKAAEVHLLEIRLAMALGGKAFCVLSGDVAAVRAAVEAGKMIIGEKGLLTNWAVIPAPNAALVKELLGGRLL
jgi:microcompartment protein CcmL/EutN